MSWLISYSPSTSGSRTPTAISATPSPRTIAPRSSNPCLAWGPILGAEFIAIVGDLSRYHDAGRLASHAGLAPVPRDSGRRIGNYHRPKRYNRRLRHIFYLSAQTAMMRPGPSRDYYLKKRAEGMLHTQALLALARRRVDVLWAMLRDNRPFTSSPPITRTA